MNGDSSVFADEIAQSLRIGCPAIWLQSQDERRAIVHLSTLSAELGRTVILWSCVRGLHTLRSQTTDAKTQDPVAALDQFAKHEKRALLVLCDVHSFLAQAMVLRKLRESVAQIAANECTVVALSPLSNPFGELQEGWVQHSLPDLGAAELLSLLEAVVQKSSSPSAIQLSSTEQQRIIQAGRTLSETNFVFAIKRTLGAEPSRFCDEAVQNCLHTRRQDASAGSLLEPVGAESTLDRVGGLDALKRWVQLRGRAFSPQAREFGIDPPRGVLIAGVQGTGKSLCAQAVAATWRLPLLRLDLGRMFQGLVGASEANIRRALYLAEQSAPCVLWLDELGRALGGIDRGGDAGTSQRVLGYLLTWLQEQQASVFVVATTNDVSGLPPELLRKGRFDELFFVDLPAQSERVEIAAIHLQKRKRDPSAFALDVFAQRTDGFCGADIEQCVVSALFYAFADGRAVADGDLLRAARECVPLAKTASESIAALRRWSVGRARSASSAQDGASANVVV